jgi:hypothetical protein
MVANQLIFVFLGGFLGIIGSVGGSYLQARLAKKREIKNSIYRPLFNEVNNISESGELPYERSTMEFESVWRKFDAYQRFYVKETIAGQMAMLEGHLSEFEGFLELLQYELRGCTGQSSLIVNHDGGPSIIRNSGENGEPESYISVDDWVRLFAVPLIQTKDLDDLEENLIEYSQEQADGHYRDFQSWTEAEYRVIWQALESAESKWDWVPETSYEHYLSVRERARMAQDEVGEKVLGLL